MTDETIAAGTTTEPTGQAAGTTGDQPDLKDLYQKALADAAEWKNRFNGLQGTYQREQAKWKQDVSAATEMKTVLESLTAEKAGLQSKVDEISDKLGLAETEKELAASNLERMTIVVTEFPHLIEFFSKGLVPDGSGDELREKLRGFSETLEGMKTSTLEAFKSGGSPAQVPKPKADTSKTGLQTQLIEAFRTNNITEYNRLYDELLKHGGQ